MKENSKQTVSSKKRENILQSALEVFLELGYGNTTIDEIVKRAGGSKATVYKHFKNKEELFTTVVDELVRHRSADELNPDEIPLKALLDYAESRLTVVFTKEHISIRRLVIGEGSRFPKIAKMYYDHGPGLSRKQLEQYFKEAKRRGSLDVADAETAAIMFQGALMHDWYLRTLFTQHGKISKRQIKEHAKSVVDEFLKLYSV